MMRSKAKLLESLANQFLDELEIEYDFTTVKVAQKKEQGPSASESSEAKPQQIIDAFFGENPGGADWFGNFKKLIGSEASFFVKSLGNIKGKIVIDAMVDAPKIKSDFKVTVTPPVAPAVVAKIKQALIEDYKSMLGGKTPSEMLAYRKERGTLVPPNVNGTTNITYFEIG